MKKIQVIVIHGGSTFASKKEYIENLRTKEVSPDRFKIRTDWKNGLQKTLGSTFDVYNPGMPGGGNAQYEEWKIWFERMFPFIEDNAILAGHSLGGIFFVKYLSENSFPKKIRALFLIAAPFDDEGSDEPLLSFALPSSLGLCAEQAKKIFLFQSDDDSIVPPLQAKKYKQAFPKAKLLRFKDRGHFLQEKFPEFVEMIKSCP